MNYKVNAVADHARTLFRERGGGWSAYSAGTVKISVNALHENVEIIDSMSFNFNHVSCD